MGVTSLIFDLFVRDHGSESLKAFGKSAKTAGDDVASGGSKAEKGSGGFTKSGKNVDEFGRKLKGTHATLKTFTEGLAAGFGAEKAFEWVKEGVEGAEQLEKAYQVANRTLKNTGSASGESAKGLEELTDSIHKKTTVDKQQIVSSENVLLAFKDVKNATGEGADMFDRATKAATDMAAAGFGSVKTNAKLLGKALTDPAKGLAQLTRAGVTFTDQQKAQVKALAKGGYANAFEAMGAAAGSYQAVLKHNKGDVVKTLNDMEVGMTESQKKQVEYFSAGGHLAEAQKMVMGQVEGKFKGAAQAAVTPLDKLKMTSHDLGEEVGAKLIPVLSKAATDLSKAFDWAEKHQTTVKIMGGLLVGLAATFGILSAAVKVQSAVTAINRVFTDEATGAQWSLNAAMEANPIGLIVVALVGLAVGFVELYKHSEKFRAAVQGLWHGIESAGKWIGGEFVSLLHGAENALKSGASKAKHFGSDVGDAFKAMGSDIKWVWNHSVGWYFRMYEDGIKLAFKVGKTELGLIVTGFKDMGNGVKWVWNHSVSPVYGWLSDGIGDVRDDIKTAAGKIEGFFGGIGTKIGDVWDDAKAVFKAFAGGHGIGVLKTAFSTAESDVKTVWDRIDGVIKNPLGTGVKILNKFISVVDDVLPGTPIKKIKGWSTGGYTGDEPVDDPVGVVHGDEFVVNSPSRRKFEAEHPGWLDWINSTGKLPGYKVGGVVKQKLTDALHWARGQVGKPYEWTAVGPNGYDCSGLTGAVYNVFRGVNPYQRDFATGSEGAYLKSQGFQDGPGDYTIGWTTKWPGETAGHTVSSIFGTNIESRSGAGVLVGSKARSPMNKNFTHQMHLGDAGAVSASGGSSGSWWGKIKSAAEGAWDKASSTWSDLWGETSKEGIFNTSDAKDLLKPAFSDLKNKMKIFDTGGMLAPGGMALNLSTRPERILSGSQTERLEAAMSGGTTASVGLTKADAELLADALAARGVGAVYLDGKQLAASVRKAERVTGRAQL